ncbi:hypothetical protein BEP19_10150 [Ammoniphilus oxalaticus]|uniref:Uncharacterized protein n=1 Tax=Ammoniphilus oxalaticus TaxID=66863 RepID=A0A419SFP7_9BACL|nr:sugar-binding domain-containing protein [Ammoniphilus oxalaticus]RKD22613.1 hypothetical protein BEP19_10150 [Ammoniphilus oxalaticus]
MRDFFSLQLKLVPDLIHVMQRRLHVLRNIYLQQPIGRRSLAASLNTTERILRGEVEFLKEQGFVRVENVGMSLTDEGLTTLESLESMIKDLYGLSEYETKLQEILNVKRVIVAPGQSAMSDLDKKELGRTAASLLLSVLSEDDIVAVTGGSTVAMMAEMMNSGSSLYPSVLFVPARGGLGENVELQASHIAARCASKLGAQYRMFHVSDFLGAAAYEMLQKDPYIREMLTLIRSAKIVVHGIGQAMEMAIRRKAPDEILTILKNGNAVGEAFGYYFDQDGNIVYRMETMGLQLEQIKSARVVVGLAGGAGKAKAIDAIAKSGLMDVLIMDESAAKGILALYL